MFIKCHADLAFPHNTRSVQGQGQGQGHPASPSHITVTCLYDTTGPVESPPRKLVSSSKDQFTPNESESEKIKE